MFRGGSITLCFFPSTRALSSQLQLQRSLAKRNGFATGLMPSGLSVQQILRFNSMVGISLTHVYKDDGVSSLSPAEGRVPFRSQQLFACLVLLLWTQIVDTNGPPAVASRAIAYQDEIPLHTQHDSHV